MASAIPSIIISVTASNIGYRITRMVSAIIAGTISLIVAIGSPIVIPYGVPPPIFISVDIS